MDDGRSGTGTRVTPASLRELLPSALSAAVAFMVIELWLVWKRVPLGHDESVYLLRARYLTGAASPAAGEGYWAPYRAPGLPALLAAPMRVFGESVSMSRAIVALLGGGCVLATSWLAGRLAGRIAGSIAPWIVVMTSAFTSYASLVLLDVPGTFVVVLAALVVERSTWSGRVSWFPLVLLPAVCMGAVYLRFGATTNLAAAILGVLVARADRLLAAGRRLETLVRLGLAGAGSLVLTALVLVVPAVTGSRASPLRTQRLRQQAKDLSPWASYGDTFDLLWPNGSRTGETFTWLTLSVVVIGSALTIVAAIRGYNRRAAVAGVVSVVVWIIGLNYALAEMFGNYLGLGAPFVALLVAPGWAWAFRSVATTITARRIAWALACAVTAVGCTQVMNAAEDQVESQTSWEPLRRAGVRIGQLAPDHRCGIITSYVQFAWYADCAMNNFSLVALGRYASRDPDTRGVFDLDDIDADHIYVALVDRGKRQPEGDDLERLLSDSELVFELPELRRPIRVYRIIDIG